MMVKTSADPVGLPWSLRYLKPVFYYSESIDELYRIIVDFHCVSYISRRGLYIPLHN